MLAIRVAGVIIARNEIENVGPREKWLIVNLPVENCKTAVTPCTGSVCPQTGNQRSLKRGIVSIMSEQSELTIFLKDYIENCSSLSLRNCCRADSANAVEIACSTSNAVLIDASVPSSRTLQSVYLLKRLRPDLTVVVLTQQLNLANFIRYLQAGADGFFEPPGTSPLFEETVRDAMEGWKPFPREIGKILAEHLARRFVANNGAHLTQAEAEVLASLVHGKHNKDIAAERGISELTVHAITNSLYKKMRAHSRTQVVERFLPLGKTLAIARRLNPKRRRLPMPA